MRTRWSPRRRNERRRKYSRKHAPLTAGGRKEKEVGKRRYKETSTSNRYTAKCCYIYSRNPASASRVTQQGPNVAKVWLTHPRDDTSIYIGQRCVVRRYLFFYDSTREENAWNEASGKARPISVDREAARPSS